MRGREEVGQDERRGLARDGGGIGNPAGEAFGHGVQRGIRAGGADRVGILVHGEDASHAEARGGDGEDARTGAEIDCRRGRAGLDDPLELHEATGGRTVMPGAEGPCRLDHQRHASGLARARLPRRDDQKARTDGKRTEVRAPGLAPVGVGQRGDGRGVGRREAERAKAVGIGPDARGERRGLRVRGKERAEGGRATRHLLFDHAESAELPQEVGERLGDLVGSGDGELPVSGGHQSRSFFIRSRKAEISGVP